MSGVAIATRGSLLRRTSPRINGTVKLGVAIVAVIALVASLAPLIAPYAPNQTNFLDQLQSPSLSHLMGTDSVGRDVFSRTLYGTRVDLLVMLFVTFVPLPLGVLAGALAGYFGGWIDAVISRLAETTIAFPFLVLVMAIIAMVGPGLKGVMIGIPIAGWALYARMARSEMLVVREQSYMLATKTLGYSTPRAIFRHAAPTIVRTSLVYSTVDMIVNLLLIAGLSYLGLGQQPPNAELGSIIADGQVHLLDAWWISTLPGLVLVALGVGIGLIGEGLSDGDLLGRRST